MKTIQGLSWLLNPINNENIFIVEEINEEQIEIRNMAQQFIEQEVAPYFERLEKLEPGLMCQVLKKSGELGLLGCSIPEEFNGLNKDGITNALVNEEVGKGHSFSVSFSAHVGIGTLPILYFGTIEQKKKYVTKLATGEWIGAYGLTEPSSGSDALSAKTTATLSEDKKHYIINGQKCWITNGGFADVFSFFAKIDGKDFTGFIVEKGTPGFTHGAEEHKMGIKGSSTVQLYFQDCKIPVENVLGEIGKGHKIAFNILNIGRLKLSIAAVGGAKKSLKESALYALNRQQFNMPIARFGAIKYKIGQMVVKIWILESVNYRIVNDIDQANNRFTSQGKSFNEAALLAAEEFAVECSIAKVAGSEILDFIVDEGVQIHGGNGFSDEYLISRAYRDSRINRIFEGTNEINRLLIFDMIIKRAMSGKIDLLSAAKKVAESLTSIPDFNTNSSDDLFAEQKLIIYNFKQIIFMVAGLAAQKFLQKLTTEQELIMCISDIIIETYLAESGLGRLQKLQALSKETNSELLMVNTFLYEANFKIQKYATDAIGIMTEPGDEQKMLLLGLKRFTKINPINIRDNYRQLAKNYFSQF